MTPPALNTRLPYNGKWGAWLNEVRSEIAQKHSDLGIGRQAALDAEGAAYPYLVRWPEYNGRVQVRDDLIFFASRGDMTLWMYGNDLHLGDQPRMRDQRRSLEAKVLANDLSPEEYQAQIEVVMPREAVG